MAALSSAKAPHPPQLVHPSSASTESADRHHLLHRAEDCERQARQHADSGDLTTAARLILQGLDWERRAGGLGPQVLQLIKPR